MTSKYPPSERVSAGRILPGEQLLIRERQTDQPYGTVTGYDREARRNIVDPLAVGVWTVVDVRSDLELRGRRASRTYWLTLEHHDAGRRTIGASPSERFNRVTS